MKSYFNNLFNYDRYANNLILEMIIKTNAPAKTVGLMAHLLVAQQVWLNRCKGVPVIINNLWPDWHVRDIEQVINNNHIDWINCLDELNTKGFERMVSYKNLQGNEFQNKFSDIITHVINHGTHHRAQIGQHLKSNGENLQTTDYIFYIRNQVI